MRALAPLTAFIALAAAHAACAGPAASNFGPGVRMTLTAADFDQRRPDGRFDSNLGFAMDWLRRMKPVYSFDDVKTAGEMPEWRAKVRAKLRQLLQIGDVVPRAEFALVSESMRDGYRLYRYEFQPEERLVVPVLVLVPEKAIATGSRVPAVICMPGSGAGLNSLAGEPDTSYNHFPLRNRQAWFYAKAGMVAVAIENPATAENGVPGVDNSVTQMQFARLMSVAGRSSWGFMTEHVLQVVDFLKGHPQVDARRIAVSGLSLGCIPTLYSAVLSDDISAVVYNDFVCSWAIRAMACTEVGREADPRRPFGFYRWFDDQPDLMAAVAPRPMILSEGGPWRRHIEKVKRAYDMAGASDRLKVAYYEKFADPSTRKFENVDIKASSGLMGAEYLLYANVDAPQHSFHPDVNLPWLCEVFLGSAELSEPLRREVEFSARSPGLW